MRYSAFISYNHRDRRWASWLHRELERYKIPRPLLGRDSGVGPLGRHLPPVFQDRQELAASTDLAASVRDALSQSASLIVICSKNGAASRWVNEEVREFIRLGRRDRIQCMIVPEAAAGSSEASRLEEVVPPALLELGSEPLAADARKSGDGKGFAFLKLVAGIIGVRFDELRQREQIRRQRRLLAFAGAASVGFLVTTGLSAFAFISRAEAVRQRDIARQETMTAERTTDFVKGLFQVSDPSEAKGQSITAREVLDRGAVQIEGSLDNEPDVKADLISTLSEVYMGLGSFRRADGLIRRSLSLNVARPETRARQLGVLASSQALQGNYENAVSGFVHALAFIKKPAALQDPSLYSKLLAGEAESDAALERYGPASQLAGAAIRWDRKNSGAASPAVARDLESSGLVAQYSGDLAAAQKSYSGALSIRLDHVETAVVRHLEAQMIELLVETSLGADRGGFAFIACPAFDRVTAAIGHIERSADVPLRSFGKARELLHFGDQHRAACRLAGPRNHEPDSLVPRRDHAAVLVSRNLTTVPPPIHIESEGSQRV